MGKKQQLALLFPLAVFGDKNQKVKKNKTIQMGHLNIFLICLSGLPHICAKISSQNCLSATLPVQIHGPSGSSPGH